MNKTLELFLPKILKQLGAEKILRIDKIQNLWSDYGAIYRLYLEKSKVPSVVVKCISYEKKDKHPRGWASNRSHQRKLDSYKIENNWYENYAASLPKTVKVPQLLYSEERETAQLLVLEDLSTAYPTLKQSCSYQEAEAVVKWLAQFHAHFLNAPAKGLWATGSYWHLETRAEEWQAMESGPLKEKAKDLDLLLSKAKFQTIIHGDAKVANFCFGDNSQVAAVDFQYVGKGVGVKDLAYFIGSCFTSEKCTLYEDKLLDCYFEELNNSNKKLNEKEKITLEKEWRELFPIAWADFNRFLMGWLPSHHKLHKHAMVKNKEALRYIERL